MDMMRRFRYLKVLQEKYFMAKSRKEKSSILDEYCGNTGQNRKYAIGKINISMCVLSKIGGGKSVACNGLFTQSLVTLVEKS